MKLWLCDYYWYGSYGAYERIHCIVSGETKGVALGRCLETYQNTQGEDWGIEELKLTDYEVKEISRDQD